MKLKIGTWNLAGRWDHRHSDLLNAHDCDVWLLTEVSDKVRLHGYDARVTAGRMRSSVAWSSVLGRGQLEPLPDPHPASAAARVDGVILCSSILPWRSCGARDPWVGAKHAERTQNAVDRVLGSLPDEMLVWGGDWNHAFFGTEYAGSMGGRTHVLAAVKARGLSVPTRDLPHHLDGVRGVKLGSIDHIAVPSSWVATGHRIEAAVAGVRLSDHDAYVVEVTQT